MSHSPLKFNLQLQSNYIFHGNAQIHRLMPKLTYLTAANIALFQSSTYKLGISQKHIINLKMLTINCSLYYNWKTAGKNTLEQHSSAIYFAYSFFSFKYRNFLRRWKASEENPFELCTSDAPPIVFSPLKNLPNNNFQIVNRFEGNFILALVGNSLNWF